MLKMQECVFSIFLKKLRFLKKLALCLDKEVARLSCQKIYLVAAQKEPKACKLSHSKKQHFIFLWAKGNREGITPLLFCDTQDSKKQRSIRENVNLRG